MDQDPAPAGGTNVIDCDDYRDLSAAPDTANGNFAPPHANWLTLAAWQTHNGRHSPRPPTDRRGRAAPRGKPPGESGASRITPKTPSS
jgi:hypothetical protein